MRLRWRAPMLKPAAISRRRFLKAAGAIGTVLAAGCDRVTESETARSVFGSAETLNLALQRALGRNALAAEFAEADLSPVFKANGTTDPDSEIYDEISQDGFANWRLDVGGLVEQPAKFSLADLRALPS